MSKDEAILRYKSAMAVFKNWHANGIISDDDLQSIATRQKARSPKAA